MSENPQILSILQEVAEGKISPQQASECLSIVENLGYARIDHSRMERCGFPEVIYAQNKTVEQCVAIADKILIRSEQVLLTRVTDAIAVGVCEQWGDAEYNKLARTIRIGNSNREIPDYLEVLVVSAGTSDLPVAEEAVETLKAAGIVVQTLYDVGVAGLHRLLENIDFLRSATVVIVVAGMEGALPSVIGGLISAPLIAVPTSIGYGANFGGVSALLGMLNSCASGIGVVNIDNGFGAGCMAARIINSTRNCDKEDT